MLLWTPEVSTVSHPLGLCFSYSTCPPPMQFSPSVSLSTSLSLFLSLSLVVCLPTLPWSVLLLDGLVRGVSRCVCDGGVGMEGGEWVVVMGGCVGG